MNATHVAAHEGREAGWWEGSAVVGGSVTDVEHQERRHPLPAGGDPDPSTWRERGRDQLRRDDAHLEHMGNGGSRLSHASFFSGVGGLDIGLTRAGWRTVSFSEIDPYASAVLSHHWTGVPNLGDITKLAHGDGNVAGARSTGEQYGSHGGDWTHATLWSGGFPCTDLSIAGKRKGLGFNPYALNPNDDPNHGYEFNEGLITRSGLAFAFLDLVERHRPEAILLENVYGLFSSHSGRDLGRLIRQMDELGYVGAWRGTDAQWFGVPQRRKRVFILAFDAQRHPDPDGPAQVLAVGTRCRRDHPQEREAWAQAPRGSASGAGVDLYNATARFAEWVGPDQYAGTLSARDWKSSNHLVSAPADSRGVRTPDGMAGWLDRGSEMEEELPEGIDSHRYRCAGNGVVAPVAYWIGTRLRRYFETCV